MLRTKLTDEQRTAAIRKSLLDHARDMEKLASACEQAANANEDAGKTLLTAAHNARAQVLNYLEAAQTARANAAKL